MNLRRRTLIAAVPALLAAPAFVRAQALEKASLTLAVGGKNLLYYLPLTVAEQLGYEDMYYFSRLFRKVVGMAPSHYRALHQG